MKSIKNIEKYIMGFILGVGLTYCATHQPKANAGDMGSDCYDMLYGDFVQPNEEKIEELKNKITELEEKIEELENEKI